MAYVDKQLTVADEQAVTATAVSTNFFDSGATPPIRDVGAGQEVYMVFTVDEAVTAAGAATVTFEVVQADDAAGTTNVEVLAASAAIGKAALTLGAEPFAVVLPSNTRRFIGARFTVATGPLTAGKFTAGMQLDRTKTKNYASGYPNAY